VDVSDDRDGSRNVDDIALLHQQLLCLGTYRLDDRVCQQFLLVEPLDAFVQINAGWETM